MAGLYIGTSGWMYKDWGEKFYPKSLKKGHLSYLAREFNTVEVNSSFYHLPLASTFKKWHDETPKDFVFAVKISRFITHRKKLEGVSEPTATFMRRAKHLSNKLGVVLVQLPPFLRYDRKTLKRFLAQLTKYDTRFALEPRHKSWMQHGDEVITLLRKHKNVSLVFPHSAKIPSFAPEDNYVAARFVYVRFHGPSEFAASAYGARRLKPWAARIKKWRRRKLTVFVYFNNDQHGHAVDDARTLKKLIDS